MACLICGSEYRKTKSLFEFDGEVTSVGTICRQCIRQLKAHRPNSLSCGFGDDSRPCGNEAVYGTGSLERMRDAGSVEPATSMRTADEMLLCPEHGHAVADENKTPRWL